LYPNPNNTGFIADPSSKKTQIKLDIAYNGDQVAS